MNELIILDTDILIDVGRNVDQAVKYLQEAEKQFTPAISVITQLELMAGCRNKTEGRTMNRFLLRFEILKLREEISDIAVDLMHKYRQSHGLAIPDALIAATAIAEKKPFVTKNQRDFRFIAELNLLTYA